MKYIFYLMFFVFSTANAGTLDFILDGVPQGVNVDTSTPSNSNPYPMRVHDVSGVAVSVATEPTVVSMNAKIPHDLTVQSNRLLVDISGSAKILDSSGASIILGQKQMQESVPVVLATNQSRLDVALPLNTSGAQSEVSLVGTIASVSVAPASAAGFVVQALDANTDNIRYMVGGTASAAQGMQLQPGRDSGFIPANSNVSVCAEASGTNAYQIQWIMQ